MAFIHSPDPHFRDLQVPLILIYHLEHLRIVQIEAGLGPFLGHTGQLPVIFAHFFHRVGFILILIIHRYRAVVMEVHLYFFLNLKMLRARHLLGARAKAGR